jgi:hypothetical protein
MASTQKIRLLVKDDDGVIVLDDEIECSATGEQLFNEMNRRCEFRKWERADMWVDKAVFAVSNSGNALQDQAYAKEQLRKIIDSLPTSGEPCRLTVQVRKKDDVSEYETNSDTSGGPVAPKNPGLKPRHGPDYGGFETPEGPEGTLARMRGTLARV